MALNLISNYAAQVAQRNLAMSDSAATNSLAKLSAGTRVLSAKDDAASLAVGSRLAAQVAGLKQASVNAGQAVSMLQIADGAMAQVNDVLTRMKSLAVQAGSGQLSGTERHMIDTEYQALLSEVDRIASVTDFAGTSLVNGAITVTGQAGASMAATDGVDGITFRGDFTDTKATTSYNSTGGFTVSTGDGTTGDASFTGTIPSGSNDGTSMSAGSVVTLTNAGTTDKIDITLNQAFSVNTNIGSGSLTLAGSNVSTFSFKVGTGVSSTADDISVSVNGIGASALGINATDVTSASNADVASVKLSNAIDDLQTYRANIGASQNRLQFATANLATVTENTEAARSQLLDLDVASEMSSFTSKQILVQAGVSMLAQANQLPQSLIKLFQ
jgi:flagellin